MRPKISVIITAYNAASVVCDAIDSAISQTLQDIEIVVVDDGSTDTTKQVVEKFCKKDDRVVYLHQENAGAMAARKAGWKSSHGEYICFVDADDTLPVNALKEMYERASAENIDILMTSYYIKEESNIKPVVNTDCSESPGFRGKHDYVVEILKGKCGPWARIFKSSLYNEQAFALSRKAFKNEDAFMNVVLFMDAARIAIASDIFGYCYTVGSPVSVSRRNLTEEGFNELIDKMKAIFVEHGVFEEYKLPYYTYCYSRLSGFFYNRGQIYKDRERLRSLYKETIDIELPHNAQKIRKSSSNKLYNIVYVAYLQAIRGGCKKKYSPSCQYLETCQNTVQPTDREASKKVSDGSVVSASKKEDAFSKNRIIKNSATLYVRMMFTMVLNLLTTRFVLAALGVEDMGVYGVVGSIVSMFTVFVSGLLSAAQRFITYELGKPDGDVRKVFNTSTNLILLLSLALLLIMEVGGWLMVEYGLNIPDNRVAAAHWVLQFSILTCILNLNTTVYSALIIAHERMTAWAVISIIQVVFTCSAAYSLTQFAESERLIWYAALAFAVQIVIQTLYMNYCKHHFPETKYQRRIDKPLVREMARFAGASTFSGILQMVISQGLTLIVNWTYGVAVNAVYNIGGQVRNAALSFGQNIYRSIAPQITKTYAAGEYDRHCKLVYSGSKLGVYMTMLIFIPFCLRSHYILELWLGQVPPYTSVFTVGLVFQSLLYSGFEPFRTAVLATGRVGRFFVYSELVHMLVLPFAYIVGRLYDTPTMMVIIIVVMEFVYCAAMMWLGTRVSKISVRAMVLNVALPVIAVLAVSFASSFLVSHFVPQGAYGLVAVVLLSCIIISIAIYAIGLSASERIMVKNVAQAFINKIRQ